MRSNGPFRLSLCIVLIAGLVFPFSIQPVHAENRYMLLQVSREQPLPDRDGLFGVRLDPKTFGTLADGTKVATPTVLEFQQVNVFTFSPLEIGDQIYAINGTFFRSVGDMLLYIRSLSPGSLARVEYFSTAHAMAPYVTTVIVGSRSAVTDPSTSRAEAPPSPSPPPPAPRVSTPTAPMTVPDETQDNKMTFLKLLGIGAATIAGIWLLNKMSSSGGREPSSPGSGGYQSGSQGSAGQYKGEPLNEAYEKQQRKNLEAEEKRFQEYENTSKGHFWAIP